MEFNNTLSYLSHTYRERYHLHMTDITDITRELLPISYNITTYVLYTQRYVNIFKKCPAMRGIRCPIGTMGA